MKCIGIESRQDFLEMTQDQDKLTEHVRRQVMQFHSTMVVRVGGGMPYLKFDSIIGPNLSQGLDMSFIRPLRNNRYLNIKEEEEIITLAPLIQEALEGIIIPSP
jgi:hypothetical protein